MRRLRSRTSIVVVCLVAAVAGLLPLGATTFTAVLTTLWLVCPAVAIVVIRRAASRSDEQPVSLLAVLLSRAPPLAA